MLHPAVAGFTHAKLTPLLGWPGDLKEKILCADPILKVMADEEKQGKEKTACPLLKRSQKKGYSATTSLFLIV